MLSQRLQARVQVERKNDARLSFAADVGTIELASLSEGQMAAILALQGAGATEESLCDIIARTDGPQAIPWIFLTLTRLAKLGFIETTLSAEGVDLATLQPLARSYQPNGRAVPAAQAVRLCRFSYLHRHDSEMLLESPRALSRVVLHDARGMMLLAELTRAVTPQSYGETDRPGITRQTAQSFLQMLYQNDFLETDAQTSDVAQDDAAQALQQWDFHDLLFHARSRAGRHRNAWGATYRWEGRRAPLPAVKEVSGEGIALSRPAAIGDTGSPEPSFAAVVEGRRSLRIPGERPLSKDQLSEFLFRTSRVRGRMRTEHEEVSNRPYPGGGADYELEIYPLVQRVEGIEPGIYYYHPLQHRLFHVAGADAGWTALLKDAVEKARAAQFPDVLFCVTCRFQRLSYKYSSIAYAIALKDLGALYQTFYLVATAMELAPCAIGGGNADLFAAVAGRDYIIEPYIGEFILSSRDEAEWARTMPPQVMPSER